MGYVLMYFNPSCYGWNNPNNRILVYNLNKKKSFKFSLIIFIMIIAWGNFTARWNYQLKM